MALKQRATASRTIAQTGIERGDEGPRRTGFPRPLAKSGLDLAIEVQDPGFASARRTPAMVGCILSRSWSPAFHEVEPRAVHRS